MSTISLSVYGNPLDDHVRLAVLLDELGYHGLWLGEHTMAPVDYRSVSSYRRNEVVVPLDIDLGDLWVCVAAALAATARLRVATGLYIAPLRHPLATAQAAVTTSRLFPGRFLLGVGVGWLEEEFVALGQEFRHRGSRLDEIIDVVRAASRGGPFAHRGRHYDFDAVQVSRSPTAFPLVVGGVSDAALRRAARVADGWYNPGTMSLDECRRVRDRILELLSTEGRDPDTFDCHIRMRGELDAGAVDAYRATGFDHVTLPWQGLWERPDTPFETKAATLRRLADELGLAP